MIIKPFGRDDIAPFLRLAAAENWVVGAREFEFLMSKFPQGCFTAEGIDGEKTGFVTSLRHDRSGWIGNLIVLEEMRGQGVGKKLFSAALGALRSDGVETYWLTASKSGQKLYEKFGFRTVDKVIRRVGTGLRNQTGYISRTTEKREGSFMAGIDYQVWGDRRNALLEAIISGGTLLFGDSGFAAFQQSGDSWQLGPFAALERSTADTLFDEALAVMPSETRIFVDTPASNRYAAGMYARRNFKTCGTTELMCAGTRPRYRPELLYGLATMGSCG